MDNSYAENEFGMVSNRIVDGEVNKNGLGVAKKVAVGAGALAAGSGSFILGCKGAKAVGLIKDVAEGEKASIFQKAAGFNFDSVKNMFNKVTNTFSEGVLGKGNPVGSKLTEWFGSASTALGGDANFLGKVFGTMSNYPILGAAGLAGSAFFITKAVKKLVNKIKGVDDQGYSR